MFRYLVLLLPLLASPLLAQDPAPMPSQDRPVIIAPREAAGTGKRNDPFVFDASLKCILKLTGKSAAVQWDCEDAPADAEAIDHVLIFSLAAPGDYLVLAKFDGGYAKAWFTIKGPNGPPLPTNVLAARLRAALAGAEAAKDSVQFSEIMRGVADAVEATPPATHKPLKALWDATLKSNSWPAGKYPLLPDVGRMAIPTADETTPIDAVQLAAILANLRTLQKTAEAIGNGK